MFWIRLRRFCILTFAMVAVVGALVAIGVSYVTSQVPEYRQYVEVRLAKAFGRDVRMQDLQLVWRGIYPQVQVNQLVLPASGKENADPITIDRLHITLEPLALLQKKLQPTSILLQGVKVNWLMTDGPQRSIAELRQMLTDITGQLGELETDSQPLRVQLRNGELILTAENNPDMQVHLTSLQANATVRNGAVQLNGDTVTPDKLGGAVRFALTAAAEKREGRFRVQTSGLQADADWLRRLVQPWVQFNAGVVDVDANMRWQADAIQVNTQLTLYDLAYQLRRQTNSAPAFHPQQAINQMAMAVEVEHRDDVWWLRTKGLQVDVAGTPWLEGDIELRQTADGVVTGKVDFAKLDDVLPLVQPWLDQALPKIGGNLRDITFRYAVEEQDWSVWGVAEQVWLAETESNPSVRGLNGKLMMSPHYGQLAFFSNDFAVFKQDWFAEALQFEQIKGLLQWHYTHPQWQITLRDLAGRSTLAELTGEAQLLISLLPTGDVMPVAGISSVPVSPDGFQIAVDFTDMQLTKLADYLPVALTGVSAQKWLKQAKLSGLATGQLTLSGNMRDGEIDENMQFSMTTDYQDIEMHYLSDWPMIRGASGTLQWQNSRVTTTVAQAAIADYPLKNVALSIGDIEQPYLDIQADLSGNPQPLFLAMQQLPLFPDVSQALAKNDYVGGLDVTLDLHVGLVESTADAYRVVGDLRGLDIIEPDGMRFDNVTGRITIDDAGIHSKNLEGLVMGIPVQVALQQDFATQASPNVLVNGTLDLDNLANGYSGYADVLEPLQEHGLLEHWQGQLVWQAEITFEADNVFAIRLNSDTTDLASTLSGQLGKSQGDVRALQADVMQSASGQRQLAIRWQDTLAARLEWLPTNGAGTNQLHRAAIHLGESVFMPTLPQASGVVVSGSLDQINLDQWAGLSSFTDDPITAASTNAVSAAPQLPLSIKDFAIAQLQAEGLNFGALTINLQHQGLAWDVQLMGDRVNGQLQQAVNGHISGRIDKLHLPALPSDTDSLIGDVTAEGGITPELGPSSLPTDWPIMAVDVDHLQLGDFSFGKVALNNRETLTGREFSFSAQGGDADVQLKLRWDAFVDASQNSDVQFQLTTQHMDKLLAGFGYADMLKADTTVIGLRAGWEASPTEIELQQLYGDLTFKLKDGTLQQVDPGIGRLVGLFNFYRLPNRLMGDFRDMTEDGMAFDQFSGSFRFADGQAYSSDLLLNSAAADATFVGRVGLADKDYDVHARIQPKLASGVGVAGALIAGASTGGALLLVQEIFAVPLQELTEIRYHLSGDWVDPKLNDLSIQSTESGAQAVMNPMSATQGTHEPVIEVIGDDIPEAFPETLPEPLSPPPPPPPPPQ